MASGEERRKKEENSLLEANRWEEKEKGVKKKRKGK